MVRRRSEGVWGRLQAYLTRGLRLLDAAQVESLGGIGSTTPPSLPAHPITPEGSPDYPGNWTSPFESLFAAAQPWSCDDWALQVTAQTTMVGRSYRNRELFGLLPPYRAAMMVSALGESPDWRQLSVAVDAGLQAIVGDTPDTLPCHLGHHQSNETTSRSCKAPGVLQWAMQQSNRALLSWGMERPGRHGLCAGAMLHFCCDRAWFVQLGGLRLYRWRDGALQLLSASEETEPRPLPHPTQPTRVGSRGTRFLGFRELPRLPVSSVSLQVGDILALASPGLHEAVSHHTIEQTIGEHPDAIETACLRLIDVAWNTRPQPSDISLLLARVTDDLRARRRHEAARWHAQLEHGLF